MPRYIWKTVNATKFGCDAQGRCGILKGYDAWSQHDGKQGWRIGVWRKLPRIPVLCRRGYHGNRHPLHAMAWGYGQLLALVEVAGASDGSQRVWRGYHPSKGATKEAYQEARIVALWNLAGGVPGPKSGPRQMPMWSGCEYGTRYPATFRPYAEALVTWLKATPPMKGAVPRGYRFPKYDQLLYTKPLPKTSVATAEKSS